MNRFHTLSRTLSLAICAAIAVTPAAQAQQDQSNRGERGGVLPLPEGVRRVIAIDAQNTLLAEMGPEDQSTPSEYRAIKVQHVYVGGIARLFGGEVIPTEDFISPGFSRSNNTAQDSINGQRFRGLNNQNNQNGNNGFNGYGQNGFNNGQFNNGFGAPVPGGYSVPNGVTTYTAPNIFPNTPQQATTGVFYNGRRVFQRSR